MLSVTFLFRASYESLSHAGKGSRVLEPQNFFQCKQNVIACSGNVAVQLFKENATNLTNTGHCSDLFSF